MHALLTNSPKRRKTPNSSNAGSSSKRAPISAHWKAHKDAAHMDTAHSSQDAAPPRTINLRAPSPLSIQASSTPGDLNTAPIGFVNYKCTSTRASASGTEVPGTDMSATGVSAASPSTSSPAPTGGQPMQIHEAHVGPK